MALTDSQHSVPLVQQLLKLQHGQVLDAIDAVDEVECAVEEGEAGLRGGGATTSGGTRGVQEGETSLTGDWAHDATANVAEGDVGAQRWMEQLCDMGPLNAGRITVPFSWR